MLPNYEFSKDYMTNIKQAYEQGAKAMQKKIYYEMSKTANTQKDFEWMMKIRNMKLKEYD